MMPTFVTVPEKSPVEMIPEGRQVGRFTSLLNESITYEYFWGVPMRRWITHRDPEWRIMPYATIVCVGDCDPQYYAASTVDGRLKLRRSSVVIFPAGCPFRFELSGEAQLSNCHISFTLLGHIDILSLFDITHHITGHAALEIAEIVDSLAECSLLQANKSIDIPRLIKMKQAAFRLLSLIIDKAPLRADRIERLDGVNRISPVLNYIDMNIDKEISRKILAATASLSETRFHYVFKEIMGVSPMDYIRSKRLRKAQHLLLATELSITDVAHSVGIHDIYYFSKVFKTCFHISPSKYRHTHKSLLIDG